MFLDSRKKPRVSPIVVSISEFAEFKQAILDYGNQGFLSSTRIVPSCCGVHRFFLLSEVLKLHKAINQYFKLLQQQYFSVILFSIY